jgi:hypothetical protein
MACGARSRRKAFVPLDLGPGLQQAESARLRREPPADGPADKVRACDLERVTERPPPVDPEADEPDDENPEFDRFEEAMKKLLDAKAVDDDQDSGGNPV